MVEGGGSLRIALPSSCLDEVVLEDRRELVVVEALSALVLLDIAHLLLLLLLVLNHLVHEHRLDCRVSPHPLIVGLERCLLLVGS